MVDRDDVKDLARAQRGLLGESNDDVSVDRLAFRYVYIPWAREREMEERVMIIPREREMECLLDVMRAHFKRAGESDGSLANDEQAQREILLKQMKEHGKNQETYSAQVLDAALNMQMAQPVALLPGSKKTGYVHVNMYVDDRGISKGLPVNERASMMSAEAGFAQTVMGDAFVARIFDDDNDFKRLDFTLDECSSDAPWMSRAKALAREREANIGDVRATMAELAGKGAVDLNARDDQSERRARGRENLPEHLRPGAHQDFEWSQHDDDVTLKVRVPAETTKADVACAFGPGTQKMTLQIATLANVPGKSMRVIDNEGDVDLLFQEIIPDESSWSLVTHGGEKAFEATLAKRKDLRWLSFLRRGGPPESDS